MQHVVLMVREAANGFPESCQPVRGYNGKPVLYPTPEAAEQAAARRRRANGLSPGTYLNNTTFVAGWL